MTCTVGKNYSYTGDHRYRALHTRKMVCLIITSWQTSVRILSSAFHTCTHTLTLSRKSRMAGVIRKCDGIKKKSGDGTREYVAHCTLKHTVLVTSLLFPESCQWEEIQNLDMHKTGTRLSVESLRRHELNLPIV